MEAKHNAKAGQLTDNSENGITGEVSVEIGVCVVAGRVHETHGSHRRPFETSENTAAASFLSLCACAELLNGRS